MTDKGWDRRNLEFFQDSDRSVFGMENFAVIASRKISSIGPSSVGAFTFSPDLKWAHLVSELPWPAALILDQRKGEKNDLL